jgi:hypothetical protein
MNGILNPMPPGILSDPRQAAMLQAGLGLLQASGPSRTPVGLGQAIGQAGMQGINAFHQTNQANQQQQMFQMKLAEVAREAEERKRREADLASLAKHPGLAGLPPELLRVAPNAAIERAFPKGGESPFAKINPKDYTPESVRKFSMTKNPSDLVAAADPVKDDDFSRSLKESGVKPGTPEWVAAHADRAKKLRASGPLVEVKNLPADKKFEWEDKLRADYKTDVKAFREVEDAHRIIKGALQNPSPANDMAAATKFMKLLDPGSVVRESELNMAMQASGVLDRMANYHNLLLKGQKLTPQQREDFAAAADIIYNNVQAKWGDMDKIYDESATAYGLDPRRVKMGGGASSNLPVRKKYNPKTGKFE